MKSRCALMFFVKIVLNCMITNDLSSSRFQRGFQPFVFLHLLELAGTSRTFPFFHLWRLLGANMPKVLVVPASSCQEHRELPRIFLETAGRR